MAISGISDQIGETFFHFPELADTKPEKKPGDTEAEHKTGPIDLAFAAKDTPAEAVNDPDHRIERIGEPPLVRDNPGAVSDRRDVEPELNDEWDDITEIPVFDVERRDPYPNAEAHDEGNRGKKRQQHDLPARHEGVPDHQTNEDCEADEEIDERNHHRCHRHDQPGKINLADEIGISDEAVRGIGKRGSKE